MEGEIAMVNLEKGFGFIRVEGCEKDLFFHTRECPNRDFLSFKQGDKVSFKSIERTPKGDAALGVVLNNY